MIASGDAYGNFNNFMENSEHNSGNGVIQKGMAGGSLETT
jgi:hypothetical protein